MRQSTKDACAVDHMLEVGALYSVLPERRSRRASPKRFGDWRKVAPITHRHDRAAACQRFGRMLPLASRMLAGSFWDGGAVK
jgi:hypothetical protein